MPDWTGRRCRLEWSAIVCGGRKTICPSAASILSAGGHALVVGKLLSLGSPVEQCDSRSRTALHWAAEQGHADAAGVLVAAMLDAGVDVHLQARPEHATLCDTGMLHQPSWCRLHPLLDMQLAALTPHVCHPWLP